MEILGGLRGYAFRWRGWNRFTSIILPQINWRNESYLVAGFIALNGSIRTENCVHPKTLFCWRWIGSLEINVIQTGFKVVAKMIEARAYLDVERRESIHNRRTWQDKLIYNNAHRTNFWFPCFDATTVNNEKQGHTVQTTEKAQGSVLALVAQVR